MSYHSEELPDLFTGLFTEIMMPHILPGATHAVQDIRSLRHVGRSRALQELRPTDALGYGMESVQGSLEAQSSWDPYAVEWEAAWEAWAKW